MRCGILVPLLSMVVLTGAIRFASPLSLQDAEAILRHTQTFAFGGMPPKQQVQACNLVFEQPDATSRFQHLAADASSSSSAGKLYAKRQDARPAPSVPPSLAGASVSSQAFDSTSGVLRFTIHNESPTDLVAWIYTVTINYATGRPMTTSTLSDHGVLHALATTPGLKNRPSPGRWSYLSSRETQEIVQRLLPPPHLGVARRPAITSATVKLSAAVFADGRAAGEPDAVARIVESRKRQAAESLPVLEALRSAGANKDVDAAVQLRAIARELPKAARELAIQVAGQLELQSDANARERVLAALIEAYEVRQAELSRAVAIQ